MPDFTIHDLSIQNFQQNAERNRATIAAIESGLTAYNEATHPDPTASPLVLAARDPHGEVIAGVLGRSAYGWLRIDVVWVAHDLRGSGHGTRLMHKAEQIAIDRGCRGIHLDTHGFQAPGFYERLGYEVFGTLDDYPTGQTHVYLRKQLPTGGA
jgi:ribosomal protein S18 acetylase RimI-like enzyme